MEINILIYLQYESKYGVDVEIIGTLKIEDAGAGPVQMSFFLCG